MWKTLTASIIFVSLCLNSNSVLSAAPEPDPVSVFDSRVYRELFGTEEIRAVFSDKAMVELWLKVEVALAKAQAKAGVIPADAAQAIENVSKIENIDFDKLRAKTNKVGRGINPLLGQLRKVGGKPVSEYLHWGSTTQDIMDTATVLQVKAGAVIIRQELAKLILQISNLAEKYKDTVMIARSNGQDAIPTTFGLHLSTFMMELHRSVHRLDESVSRLQAQIGSTVGTLAPFGEKGFEVQENFAAELQLGVPIAPWNPSRDCFAEVVQTLAMIDATLGRLALDVNNLSRTQIDELKEGEGGASSTMPQKRNPRASEFMGGFSRMGKMYNSAALDIMSHTDTRQGSPWILEWSIIPGSFMVTSASIDRASRMFTKLIVKEDNMLRNFQAAKYFSMSEAVMNAIAAKIGRGVAYSTVKKAIKKSSSGDSLRDVIEKNEKINKHLTTKDIEELLNPANYVGSASKIVDRSVNVVRMDLQK